MEELLVGYTFSVPKLASEFLCEIAGLVVAPEYRSQGIGRCLIDYVLGYFNAKFRVRCNGKRTDTHQFYESIGFKNNKIQYIFDK